jgi:indole-3-glycerol phosphate synthase
MRYAKKTPVAKVADPQNFIRASENAANTLITIVTDTTHIDTTIEFLKKVRYVFWVNSSM